MSIFFFKILDLGIAYTEGIRSRRRVENKIPKNTYLKNLGLNIFWI